MTFRDTIREVDLEVANCDLKLPTAKTPVDLAKINTLHELLALALDDFEKALGDPKYGVGMGYWHNPGLIDRQPEVCTVCLAGSVVAKTLGADPTRAVDPEEDFGGAIRRRLLALNCLREGFVAEAFRYLHGRTRGRPLDKAGLRLAKKVSDRWELKLANVCDAYGSAEGRHLLAKLRVMQQGLKEAGL